MRRALLRHSIFALVAGVFVAVWSACGTDHVALGQKGDLCDYDDQCDPRESLVCACVKVQNPDDEGGDQIVAPGHCSAPGTLCGGDGGLDAKEIGSDAGGSDGAADATSDASDASDSDAGGDASDADT